jgi:hypothetical protein
VTSVRDIICRCGQLLGQRQGRWFIYHSLRLTIPERGGLRIDCPRCGAAQTVKMSGEKLIDPLRKTV